jgi:hypothetical protein
MLRTPATAARPLVRPLALTALPLLALAALPLPSAGDPFGDEAPLADVLQLVTLPREVLAIDAEAGGQTRTALELDESVAWSASQGRVGVVLTNRRLLAVAVRSSAWQEARFRIGEEPPEDALVGGRVAIALTRLRAIGFDGGSGNLVERRLGPRETVLQAVVGDSVGVVVTDRRALGLSPWKGGFFEIKLRLREALQSADAQTNVATVATSQRLLVFRAPTGTWEERQLGLGH